MAALAGLIESTIYALKVNQSAVVRCFTPLVSRHTGPVDEECDRVGERARAGGGRYSGEQQERERQWQLPQQQKQLEFRSCHKCHRIWHCLPSINNKILCAFFGLGINEKKNTLTHRHTHMYVKHLYMELYLYMWHHGAPSDCADSTACLFLLKGTKNLKNFNENPRELGIYGE